MEASVKGSVDARENVSFIIKTEPIEVEIEYDAPGRAELCTETESRGAQVTTEKAREWNLLNAAAIESPTSVKKEPCDEAEPYEYSIDIQQGDVKQERLESSETGDLGAGNLHHKGDLTRDAQGFNDSKLCSISSTSHYHPEGNCNSVETSPSKSITTSEKKSSNKGGTSKTKCVSKKTDNCSTTSKNAKQVTPSTEKEVSGFEKYEVDKPSQPTRTNSGRVPHSCQDCGRTFTSIAHLHSHIRVHTGEKPHTCLECGKSFSWVSNLNIHTRIHTGEKPHICQECGKSFSWISNLNTHMRTHTGEKPHACQECSKSFSDSSSLWNHMRIHTGAKPHACQECGKSFRRTTDLNIHMRIHTGEKPYNCQKCTKSFSVISALYRHQKIHT